MSARKFLSALAVLSLLFAAIAGAWFAWARYEMSSPGPLAQAKTVFFPRGTRFVEIADKLAEEGVIRRAWVFKTWAVLTGSRRQFKAGEYEFAPAVSADEVMEMVASGKVVVHKLTVAEGLTTAQILELVKNEPRLSGEIAGEIGEGELWPETYHFMLGDSRAVLVQRMRQDMLQQLAEMWAARDMNIPLSTMQEALTLASIVEKETGLAAERPRVAAVFYNRLAKGMKLQSDPTTRYAIEREKGPMKRALTYKDLEYPSAYNTYYAAGLPPGPIANPGEAALKAVLHPPRTDELYFVADGTGGHAFARTGKEHEANVVKWRAIQKAD